MSIFEPVRYKATKHAVDNWFYDDKGRFRGDDATLRPHQVFLRIEQLARMGEILLESGKWRYIRNGKFFMPCYFRENAFFIVSFMWYEMVANTPERMQSVVKRYLENQGVQMDGGKLKIERTGTNSH